MKKYRILHIITRWMKSGGAERNTRVFLEGLNKDRYEIDLAIGRDSETEPKIRDVRVIKIPSLRQRIDIVSDLRALFNLYKLIKNNNYHLVHTHQSKAGLLGRLAARIAGCSVIVHTLHGQLFFEGQNPIVKQFYILIEKFCAKITDCLICVGRDLRDYYLGRGVGRKDQYSIIRSWINLSRFRNIKKIPHSRPVVGVVGRMESGKGWGKAIETAKLVPEADFIFIGQGKLRPLLERKAKGLENIIFQDYRPDIEKAMAVFDILAFFSKREGLSQVMVQAAAAGIPMVAFDVLGGREVIKENGFIVKQGDKEAMAEKIRWLIKDLNRAQAMGEKGRELVGREWELETIIKQNNQLYNKLLSN